MSANTPESIPTSSDKRSNRPTKKRALSPASKQSAQIDALFANPDRATSTGPHERSLAAPPEIVTNVQGSSAGAGSGEFHVYKASRRREYERLRMMDEEKETEEQDAKYEDEREKQRRLDAERTEKKRKEREKAKLRKMKGKGGVAPGGDNKGDDSMKAKLKPNVPANASAGALDGGDEPGSHAEEVGIVIHDED